MSSVFFKKIKYILGGRVLTFHPKTRSRGRVLLSHDITGFLLRDDTDNLTGHGHYWVAKKVAEIFLEKGYTVDVINASNQTFIPKKRYAYCVDIGINLDRFIPYLNSDCIKVHCITSSHTLFQNTAEYKRCLDLQKRRGVTLFPARLQVHARSAEVADYLTYFGNEVTLSTYQHIQKPFFSTPIPTTDMFPFPEEKDFGSVRKNFIWAGGTGAVHKGVDLVLEAFAQMPEYTLTLCGKIARETDFAEAYHHELNNLPNIKLAGFMDTGSTDFKKLCDSSLGIVFPSCSEGEAGSVVVSIHAGLIPILSRESGISVDHFGTILKENSIEEIKRSVMELASLPTDELKKRAKRGWETVRNRNTREAYARNFSAFVDGIESTDPRVIR